MQEKIQGVDLTDYEGKNTVDLMEHVKQNADDLTATVISLADEIQGMSQLILDMFTQSCWMNDGLFDHQYISAWEEAQEWLIKNGMIKPEQCQHE